MKRKTALTLIELIAALVIVSMLIAASLAAVSDMSRGQGVKQERHDESLVLASLRDLLGADLIHASHYRPTPNGFLLHTFSSLDPQKMQRHHLSSAVEYEVRLMGSTSWLVRTQRLGVPRDNLTELVCSGVRAISVKPVSEPENSPDDWQVVPAVIILSVEFEHQDRKPAAYTFRRS